MVIALDKSERNSGSRTVFFLVYEPPRVSRRLMCSGFGGVGLLEWVMLPDSEEASRCRGPIRPETIFNLAGQADVARSWREPLTTIRTNGEGTFNVLAAARSAGVERVVTVISSDIYGVAGPDDLPLTEQAPFRPTSPYAASKAVADIVAQQAHLGFGQDVIRARSFSHFGPGQGENAVCSAFAARIARSELSGSESIPVGNLDARRDLTDVRDVVRAYRLLATSGRAGCAYNVCSGTSTTVGTVLDILLAHAERPLRVISDPELFMPVELRELRGDATRLAADTGWRPDRSLESSLLELLDDWRGRLQSAQDRLAFDDSVGTQVIKDSTPW
jgi:GDP-4-dehydro-6-deoxy-D-mannose reductase